MHGINRMTIFKIIVNHSNDIINFISPIIGIIISAFIAWSTYRKQVVEKEVKTNVATFSYLLSLIIKISKRSVILKNRSLHLL